MTVVKTNAIITIDLKEYARLQAIEAAARELDESLPTGILTEIIETFDDECMTSIFLRDLRVKKIELAALLDGEK